MNLLLYGVGVGYNIPLTKELQAYGLAGVGASRWDPPRVLHPRPTSR